MRTYLAIAAASLLSACATPEPPLDAASLQLPIGQAVADVSPTWWQQFGDPQLDKLVIEALSNSRDPPLAMSRIDESRAALMQARAEYWPTLNAGLASAREHPSANGATPVPAGFPKTFNDHRASVDAAYEVDLWGRVANANSSARGELLATQYAHDTLRNALVAQVVQSYATLQSIDARRRVFGAAVDAQRESLGLQRMRLNAGDIGELDVRQIEAELKANELQLPKLDRARGEAERSLAVVLGRSPKAMLEQAISRTATTASATGALPDGIPSDLLRRRPDIQAAEALNADRAVWTAQADVAEERRSLAIAQSNLFRALGGGWRPDADRLGALRRADRVWPTQSL